MLWPKKSYKEFDTKKNSCSSKIPLPPHNFSNGPSLITGGDYFFFAQKEGEYSREAIISNIAHWKLGLTVVVLISGAFVLSRLTTNDVHIGVIHLHIAVPTITCFCLTLRVIHKDIERTISTQRYIGMRLKLVNTRLKL